MAARSSTESTPKIGIIGAGIGGLALCALLTRRGFDAVIYEQARQFERVGAGIQMSPNAVRVLRHLGLEQHLRQRAFEPPAWLHRVWDSGDHLSQMIFGHEAEARYGAPYLLMHRGDLHAALHSAVPAERIAFQKRLVDVDNSPTGLTLHFVDRTKARVDALIGADGVHSVVRQVLFGSERPYFTGRVAHRTVFPASRVAGPAPVACTKWWGIDRHIVVYPTSRNRDEIYFVTSVPDPDWDVESWSARAEVDEVIEAMAGFHSDVQRLLAACPGVHKWALFERDPLPRWTDGPIVLLGDACHPMTPYMAQGAATALEDAAVLCRCLCEDDESTTAFSRFERTRLERTARIQLTSRQNTWGRQPTDPEWVYGYDAWQTPIAAA